MIAYLAILVVLLDYVRLDQFVPALAVPFFFPVGVFLVSLVSAGKVSYKEVFGLANTRWLLYYLFLIVLSVLSADVTIYAYQCFTGLIIYLVIYLVLAREIDSLAKAKTLILALVLGHLLFAALNPDIIFHPEKRAYLRLAAPFLGDGNDFAWSVLAYAPLSMFLFVDSRRRFKKVMYGAFTALLLLCIVGSSSRGAAVGAMAAIGYLWLKSDKKLLGLALVAIVITSVILISPPEYTNRMETISDYENDGSAQGRLMAWGAAIRMARAHPLLGVGAGHFAVAFGVDFRPGDVGATEIPWMNAHSIYFKTLGELGLPGIIFLLGIILSNIVANERAMRRKYVENAEAAQSLRRFCLLLNASIIGWAIGGMFLSGIQYPHLFILCGFSSILRLMELRQSQQIGQGVQNVEMDLYPSAGAA